MANFFETSVNRGRATDGDKAGINDHITSTDLLVKTILFFGDSLTAGYGLPSAQSFPAIVQRKIDASGLKYKCVNAGISGDTSAGGFYRIDRFLDNKTDVFVLELGVNDGLRGIPVAETWRNLQAIIDRVKARYPKAIMILAGMQVPPYYGQQHSKDFRRMFPDLALKNNMVLIPFLLEGVAGIRNLNLPDGAHPSASGQKIVAENVWAILKEVLK